MNQIKEALLQYKPKELTVCGFSQLKRTAKTVHNIFKELDSKYREAKLYATTY
ncbi:MAG: hypothetical protein KAI53_02610 [Candidatus Aenigmarchaeota archaeon]|nr:hypothetical protein [Candidatus Aenigmarchaeota archaeon]